MNPKVLALRNRTVKINNGNVEFFAKQIPAGESEENLSRTVMFKLKGSAASFFNRILDKSWEKVKTNLIKLFGEKMSLEAIFQQVETLQQGGNEAFSAFKERVLKLKENTINADKNNTEDSYAIQNLKIHFLAALGIREFSCKHWRE